MATVDGNLWEWNLARVIVVDVSDDYRLMQPPMPSQFYPVVTELWLPRLGLDRMLLQSELIKGYLYDWHEIPDTFSGDWIVGVVRDDLDAADLALTAF